MNTSKGIAIALIIGSIALGYMGYTKIAESTNEANILGVKLEASNESGKKEGYIFLGLAVLLFFGGIHTLNKSKN